MIRGGYQGLHHEVDLIQPHDQWDYNPHANLNIPNFEKNELSMWVEHVTKQLLDDLPDPSDANILYPTHQNTENTVATPVFADLRLQLLRQPAKRTQFGAGLNPSIQWNNNFHTQPNKAQNSSEENSGLNLITLLLECAVAISVDNLGEAHRMLIELTQMASPYGSSCAERVVAYFSKAMASRVVNSWLGICNPLINLENIHSAFQVFNNISPFVKFAHFTSNQAILESFHRQSKVHIIDLDIMQGLQWPALFHILATRVEGPPNVKMTAFGSSEDLLAETGKNLLSFAKRLGLSFQFHPIAKKFGDLPNISALNVSQGEVVAVHWLQHSLYNATGPDWKTINLIQELSPKVFTLVEQDISVGGTFLDRFVASLHYYSTVFDSLGAFYSNNNESRHRVEHSLLYREINNILAIGGPARSGEDKFKHWRGELIRSGFKQVAMSAKCMVQAQLMLNMFHSANRGYSLMQGDGMLRLGWKDTSLFTASVWSTHCYR